MAAERAALLVCGKHMTTHQTPPLNKTEGRAPKQLVAADRAERKQKGKQKREIDVDVAVSTGALTNSQTQ
jgi:hypothetical protein